VLKTEKRLQLAATNPEESPFRISVVRLHRFPLHFLIYIISLQIAALCKLYCNEKSSSMLKSLFSEEVAVLHLNMAGFLKVVHRSHTAGSLMPHGWDQWAKQFFFQIKISATSWNYILRIFCM